MHFPNSTYQYLIHAISLVVLSFFPYVGSQAQIKEDVVNLYADSLLKQANSASSKEQKIEKILNLSRFWSEHDSTKASLFLNQARNLMDTPPTDFQQGLYYLYRSNILVDYAPSEAKNLLLLADSLLKRGKSAKNYYYLSKVWNNYGVIIQTEDKSEEFLQNILQKSLPYARLSGDSSEVAYQLHNIALQMENVADYEKASRYYLAAMLTIRDIRSAEDRKMEIFSNAARNEIFLRKYDTAKIYLDSARNLLPGLFHSTNLPAFYRTEFLFYRHLKNPTKALKSYNEGVKAAKRLGNDYLLTDLNFELYAFYRDLGNYQKAKYFLDLSRQTQPYKLLKNMGLFHYEMAKTEYKLGNYKSAYWQMDSLANILDSLYLTDVATKIKSLEVQHATSEKENKILKLEASNRDKELQLATNRGWILIFGAGFILTLCIAIFAWRLSIKNKKILVQTEQLHMEELRSINQREKLRQFDAMLQGQEAERNRLAKDLHDGLGGLLAGVKLKLSAIESKYNKQITKNPNEVEEVIQQLDYSVDELRRIAHNMMPESLRYEGLSPALCDLCQLMSTPQTKVTFQNLGINDQYPENLRITIYRVSQELITNAIKHAEAKSIILQCSELDDWLFITVEDNGKGMDLEKEEKNKGIGIINIQNRISLLNGQVETLSTLGEGTTVNIQIPL